MESAAEGKLLADILPGQIEVVWFTELTWIPVGCSRKQHHRGAGRNPDATKNRRATRHTEIGLDRTLEPQHLLDEFRNQAPIGAQSVLDIRMLGKLTHGEGEQANSRFLPGSKDK